jgi:hypothetical protein
MRALPTKRFGLNLGDPVCRPIGFRYPAICLGYAANLWEQCFWSNTPGSGAARGPY